MGMLFYESFCGTGNIERFFCHVSIYNLLDDSLMKLRMEMDISKFNFW